MSTSSDRPWRHATGAIELVIRLTPKGGRDSIDGLTGTPHGPAIKARVRAPPEDGAANAALAVLVADCLGLPRRHIELVSGHTSRVKTISLTGTAAELETRLEQRLALLQNK